MKKMKSTQHLELVIGNIVPHAGEGDSREIIALWRELAPKFSACPFTAAPSPQGQSDTYRISLNTDGVIDLFETAIARAGSFDRYRQLHVDNRENNVGAALHFEIGSPDAGFDIDSAYHIATVFQQQLFLAMNLVCLGSCQFVGSEFRGSQSHLYEAQTYDAKTFYDTRMSVRERDWPALKRIRFDSVWRWLEWLDISGSDIAINKVKKVLFNLLTLAQLRQGGYCEAWKILLLAQQLELLLDTPSRESSARLRERTGLVLGEVPEAADCFIELFQWRASLFQGTHPIRRPALVRHDRGEESRAQIAAHNTAVEQALAIVIALLQRLIETRSDRFVFRETLSRNE